MSLTAKQKQWIEHLSNESKITIVPFDTNAEKIFQSVKKIIQKNTDIQEVAHGGATALKISGQDEIDIFVPILNNQFKQYTKELSKLFGNPKSIYKEERVRFTFKKQNKRIDVFLVNKRKSNWKNHIIFETYLKTHPKELLRYKRLKEQGSGLSTREYYREKIEYINAILKKGEKENRDHIDFTLI